MKDIGWRIAVPDSIDSDSGIYFLRTNVDGLDEKTTWDYYDLTREAVNALGEKFRLRLYSEPNKDAEKIYEQLRYWKMPFRKIKIE